MTAQPVQVDRAVLAAAVAAALARVPGVARLSPGTGVEVATQFAGGKVVGVGVRGDAVVARSGLPADEKLRRLIVAFVHTILDELHGLIDPDAVERHVLEAGKPVV